MGSCPIKWLVRMVDINEAAETAEHLFTETVGFELHELQELEVITIDSVDEVLICVRDNGSDAKVD